MAVLLERSDPEADLAPSFLGFTGRLTQGASAAQAVVTSDGSDAPKGLVMTVIPFNDPQVQLIGEHPQLFVSNGTHAFYLASGTNTLVYPVDSQPYYCGLFEGTPIPTPASGLDPNYFPQVWIGKALAGFDVFGAIGVVAGFIWGLVEFVEGLYNVISGESPAGTATADDETGDPGTGIVVRPKGLSVPLAGGTPQDWLSQQGLVAPDGFLVDRNSQLWWPVGSQAGYQGRWGPRVETDPFTRRAGMKFPAFWWSFFIAFANGKEAGVF